MVFFMGMKNLPVISRKLMEAGMPGDMPAALVHWGTTDRHRSIIGTLKELPALAVEHKFAAPSLIIIGQVVTLHGKLGWYEQKPLLGKTVVVTRAREQGSDTARLLTEQGARVIQFPTIEVRPLDDYSAVREAIGCLGNYRWLLFTSANGVRYFWEQLETLGLDARALGGLQVAAVGSATAKSLQGRGITPDFIPESYVAESMAAGLLAMCERPGGTRMLLVRASKARSVLPDELAKHGVQVDDLPVYEAHMSDVRKEEIQALVEGGQVDCITFGSSSTVRNFLSLVPVEMLQKHPKITLACIGPITAETLEQSGLKCGVMPEEYTIQGLVEALAETMGQDKRNLFQ